MAQEVPKVDVKEFSCVILQHKVTWVTIPDAEHIGRHTLTS
jgi:hypothetical protein